MAGYSVKEIFYSLQGEGARSGTPTLFCRFAGCNLWSGRERDRAGARCNFCDTDFVGTDGQNGGKFGSAELLVARLASLWPPGAGFRRVVFTGGEPLLQLDQALVDVCHEAGFEVAIETNGTLPAPEGIDWICVSPKTSDPLILDRGDELKLVWPQPHLNPADFETLDFSHFYLQPCDGPERDTNTRLCVRYCLDHPRWSLSLQTHKLLGID